MLSVLILDSHRDYRRWLIQQLCSQQDFEVLGEAGTLVDGLEKISRLSPELVLMDFNLPDGDSLQAARQILANQPQVKIVFLSENNADEKLLAAVQSGAKGYLLKNLDDRQLLAALRGINIGQAPLSRKMVASLIDQIASTNHTSLAHHPLTDVLTPRELEVLGHLVQGGTNREIASRLYISEYTVKNHVHSILEKMHVHTRREAIRIARQRGLFETES